MTRRRRPPVDTRPPLYLTAGEAARHFSLCPEDKGREVVIVEDHIRPCPRAHIEAWKGYGRWERGFAGQWPDWTLFARSFLDRPPSWVTVQEDEYGVSVGFQIAGETTIYDVTSTRDGWLVGVRR